MTRQSLPDSIKDLTVVLSRFFTFFFYMFGFFFPTRSAIAKLHREKKKTTETSLEQNKHLILLETFLAFCFRVVIIQNLLLNLSPKELSLKPISINPSHKGSFILVEAGKQRGEGMHCTV